MNQKLKPEAYSLTKDTDDYELTFGKYKGARLSDCPADYLLWLYDQEWVEEKYPVIYSYIRKHKKELIEEEQESGNGFFGEEY